MSWKDKLATIAPGIATALGGPMAGVAANFVLEKLGLEPEASPAKAVDRLAVEVEKADPATLLRLKEIDAELETELERLYNARLGIVNETMRVEAKSDHWWVSGWRPFIGFATGFAFVLCVIFVCWLTVEAIDSKSQDAMQMIPQIIFNFTTLFGIPGAILGIASHHRGREKRDRVNASR